MSNAQIVGGVVGAGGGFLVGGPAGALYGFTLGYSLASLLFPPEIPGPTQENKAFDVTKATEGTPVPVVIGRRYVDGNIIYFDPNVQIQGIKSSITGDSAVASSGPSSKKGGSPIIGTKAMTAIHFLLSMGKLTQLHKVVDHRGRDWLKFNLKAGGLSLVVSTKGAEIPFDYGLVTYTVGIDASTASNPITLTVPNHGFLTGDTVLIQQHLINTSANGTWVITVIDQDHFTIPVAGIGIGTASGTASKTTQKTSPKFKGITTAFSKKFFCGENVASMTPLKFDIRMEADSTVGDPVLGLPIGRIDQDTVDTPIGINPANFYYMLLTDTQWAASLAQTTLNIPSFQAAWQIYKDEGLCVEVLIDQAADARDFLTRLNFHTRSILRTGVNGQLELYPLRQSNYTPIAVGENDILNLNVGGKTWDNVYNEFACSYPDRNLRYTNRSFGDRNEAAIAQANGRRRSKSYNFEWFTSRHLAARRLTELKNEESFPDSAIKLTLSKKFHAVRVGDVLSITHPKYGFLNTKFRVGKTKDAEFGKNGVDFECALEVAALYTNAFVTPPGSNWKPGPVTPQDPIDISALAHYWQNHLSFKDPAGDTNTVKAGKPGTGFKTAVFANQGSNLDVGYQARTIGAIENLLPSTSPGTTKVFEWGFRFILQQVMDVDDWTFVNPLKKTLDLELKGFPGQAFDLTQQDAVGTENVNYPYQWETSLWVMIIGGKEVVRWKNYIGLGANLYRFSGLIRGANKEALQAWPIGTEVWIAPLGEPIIDPDLPYAQWINRQQYIAQAEYDNGGASTHSRIKAYIQSIFHLGEVQDEIDGIQILFLDEDDPADVGRRTNLYSTPELREPQLAPFPAVQTWKKGDSPDREYRSWYAATPSPGAGDWVVELQPQRQADNDGTGDGLVYDAGSPLDPELIPSGWIIVGTDHTYLAIAQDATYGVSELKLEVFGPASATVPIASVTQTKTVTHGVAAVWPNFLFTPANLATAQATDAGITDLNIVFKVSLKSTTQTAYNRARKALKLGPAYF